MNITIEEILHGRSVGRMQSVGVMQVIPILGDDDDTFAPPDIFAGTTGYGQVRLRNDHDRDTIVPPGSAWVVAKHVQDHAIGSGALVPAKQDKTIDKAMCVQQSQPGLIKVDKHPIQILPARLRVKALQTRSDSEYDRLWDHIGAFKALFGLDRSGNLIDFIRGFAKELDEFVAEFELVPGQLGAVVLVGGRIAGLEVAPSVAYWESVWTPLIRVCYGALALQYARDKIGVDVPVKTRSALDVTELTLEGIEAALDRADQADREVVRKAIRTLASRPFSVQRRSDDSVRTTKLRTVEAKGLLGQVVTKGSGKSRVKYASLVATGA